jgi:hypothetical protein
MPGLPRRRPESRRPAADAGAMPRTVPILPAMPGNIEKLEVRSTTRLSWSKAIVDQAQQGESIQYAPVYQASDVRPVRSQAAARARAGQAFHPVTPAPLPAPVISVNSTESAPVSPELVSTAPLFDEIGQPVEVPESAWTRIRKSFGSLLGVFHQG